MCTSGGSDRIRHCDCAYQLKASTLVDPCHTANVVSCIRDMPEDLSCCPDEGTVTYDPVSRQYVNATGGTENTGTCISKSAVVENLERVPALKEWQTANPGALSNPAFDKVVLKIKTSGDVSDYEDTMGAPSSQKSSLVSSIASIAGVNADDIDASDVSVAYTSDGTEDTSNVVITATIAVPTYVSVAGC